jgi:hypothetical protein
LCKAHYESELPPRAWADRSLVSINKSKYRQISTIIRKTASGVLVKAAIPRRVPRSAIKQTNTRE